MHDNEINKIKSLVSETVWDLFTAYNVIIAGGAITSVYTNKDVHDLDVYFRSEKDFFDFLNEVYDGSYSLRVSNVTNRSVLMRDGQTQQDVQCIIYKWHDSVQSIFNDYDFTINMGALEFVDKKPQIILDDRFLKHNAQRYLQFSEETTYPLISALRVQKYVERGYTISKTQMLRILLAVNNLNINSWDELKDHVGGFYGMEMDDVFPEDKEFSMSVAMDTLDNIVSDKEFHSNKTYDTKLDVIQQIVERGLTKREKDDRIEANNLWFKWGLLTDDDNVARSINYPAFAYPVGSTVDGGEKGVFVVDGESILTNSHAYMDDVIIQIVETPTTKHITGYSGRVQSLSGCVYVHEILTPAQFFKKYKIATKPIDPVEELNDDGMPF